MRTDEPDRRFAPGTVLIVQRPGASRRSTGSSGSGSSGGSGASSDSLTVTALRWHSGRLLLQLEGVDDRESAEALRGTLLAAEIDPAEQPEDPDEFYDHQLIGLTVRDRNAAVIGTVAEVVHGAQDLLVVQRDDGRVPVLVPFVRAIVPQVDVAAGEIVTDLPDGLLDLADG